MSYIQVTHASFSDLLMFSLGKNNAIKSESRSPWVLWKEQLPSTRDKRR